MMHIHHTCDTIKPKPIKLILLEIKPQIAQQKPQHLMRAVIEESAIPELMSPLAAFMEVQVVRAIELVDPVEDVFACVGVHDVEKDG